MTKRCYNTEKCQLLHEAGSSEEITAIYSAKEVSLTGCYMMFVKRSSTVFCQLAVFNCIHCIESAVGSNDNILLVQELSFLNPLYAYPS